MIGVCTHTRAESPQGWWEIPFAAWVENSNCKAAAEPVRFEPAHFVMGDRVML